MNMDRVESTLDGLDRLRKMPWKESWDSIAVIAHEAWAIIRSMPVEGGQAAEGQLTVFDYLEGDE